MKHEIPCNPYKFNMQNIEIELLNAKCHKN